MSMKLNDYKLPEYVFLDGNSHEGNVFEGRTVIQHIRSYTIFEVVALDDLSEYNFQTESFEFEYINFAGVTEKHLLVLHFSLSHEPGSEELQDLFEKTAKWYIDYLKWEDINIIEDYGSANN